MTKREEAEQAVLHRVAALAPEATAEELVALADSMLTVLQGHAEYPASKRVRLGWPVEVTGGSAA